MSKSYLGKTCPYCKTPFKKGETVVFCSVCDMPHHLSCWQDNQGCTTFGCTGSIKEIIGDGTDQETTASEKKSEAVKTIPVTPAKTVQVDEEGLKPIETLYETKELVFYADTPIVLENTALIIDRTKDKLFARCTFRSITDKEIKAVLIEITCFDVWGSQLGDPVPFQYLDLKTKQETTFGQTVPVEITDKTTCKISLVIKKILFADNSVANGGERNFTLPAPVLLTDHLQSKDLAEEYARETSKKAKFVPQYGEHYWRCTCGSINTSEEQRCYQCGCTQELLNSSLNPEQLGTNMANFLAEKKAKEAKAQAEQEERIRLAEEQVRIEQAKKDEEIRKLAEQEKKKKRRKKVVIISITSIIVAAAIALLVVFFGIPYFNYQSACSALDRGEYDTAYQAFLELNGFMDSEEMANKALYKKAKNLLKEEKFDQAIAVFEDIEDYEDSTDMIIEARYLKACDYLDNKKYTQAVDLFEDISYYKNSGDKIKEAKYGYVLAHKNNDDNTTYQYLLNLKSASYYRTYQYLLMDAYYKDASQIYNDLYKWRVTGICNTDSDNYTKHESSVSKYCSYLHFSFEITGGTPGERINLTHTTIYPDGETYVSDWHWENEYDGSSFGCEWDDGIYTNPRYGATGTFTTKVYNLDTGELLGTVSTRITN